MFYTKGHMKEIDIAGGTLTLVLTGNMLELSQEERGLVFSLVDRISDFEKTLKRHEADPQTRT